jgi:hypothetical protein
MPREDFVGAAPAGAVGGMRPTGAPMSPSSSMLSSANTTPSTPTTYLGVVRDPTLCSSILTPACMQTQAVCDSRWVVTAHCVVTCLVPHTMLCCGARPRSRLASIACSLKTYPPPRTSQVPPSATSPRKSGPARIDATAIPRPRYNLETDPFMYQT